MISFRFNFFPKMVDDDDDEGNEFETVALK
jgi:hypothetical protein